MDITSEISIFFEFLSIEKISLAITGTFNQHMPREAIASKIQTAEQIAATYSQNISTFCQYIPAGGKREYVRKNNLEKIKP